MCRNLGCRNEHFLEVNGLTSEWIEQRTGIKTRSKVALMRISGQFMAIAASRGRGQNHFRTMKETGLIVFAHYCVYDTVATVAHKAQRHFGIHGAKAVYASSGASCSLFINGLEIIEGYFAMGKADKAFLDAVSRTLLFKMNPNPQKRSFVGRDAAVAYFVSKERQRNMTLKYSTYIPRVSRERHRQRSRRSVFSVRKKTASLCQTVAMFFIHACRYMIHASNNSLENSGLQREDISKFICHQA